jgi:hypothetical protein
MSHNSTRVIAGAIAVAALALSLGACGRKTDPAVTIKGGPGASVVNYQVKDANGGTAQVAVGGAGTTAATPAYAPIFPGAKVESTVAGASGGGSGGMVMFHTGAKPSEVLGFYKQKAATAGFGNAVSSQSGSGEMFAASKEGAEEGFQVTATPEGGATMVVLTWSNPKKG